MPAAKKPVKAKPITTKIYLVISVLALTPILFGIFHLSYRLKAAVSKSKTEKYKQNIPDTPPREPDKKLIIHKMTGGISETVAEFKTIYAEVVKWGNYLVFIEDQYGKNERLVLYNMHSGEKKTLFEKTQTDNNLGNLQIIEGKLYFSLGGYLISGGLYLIDSPESTPKKVVDAHNPRVENIDGLTWITAGEGDGCAGYVDYYTYVLGSFDPRKIARINVGCIDGQRYLGVDANRRLLLAGHETSAVTIPKSDFNQVVSYVTATRLDDPEVIEGVIAKQDMPPNIVAAEYLKTTNKIILFGDDIYSYDISDQTFEKVIASPTWLKIPTFASHEGELICMYYEGDKPFTLNLHERSISRDAYLCANNHSKQIDPKTGKLYGNITDDERVDAYREDLDLPSEFKITYQ